MTGTPSKQEMIKVVKSEEAKRVIEKNLKNLDENALTDKGLIKSYGIDYDSVRYNPRGGIMFDVVINNDRELIVSSILSKDTQLKIGSWSPSIKLEALLGL